MEHLYHIYRGISFPNKLNLETFHHANGSASASSDGYSMYVFISFFIFCSGVKDGTADGLSSSSKMCCITAAKPLNFFAGSRSCSSGEMQVPPAESFPSTV